MATFATHGVALDFDVSGTGGPAIVQLHGLTSSRRRDAVLRLDLARGLTPAEGRVLRYDARGHGQSSGSADPEDYRWDRLATDLLGLLQHVFPGETVHGIGPSMGTGTLLHAAAAEEDRFAGLVLAIPPTAWESRRDQAALYEEQAAFVASAGVDAFVAAGRLAPRPPAAADVPETVPDVEEPLLPTVLRGAARADLPPADTIATLTAPSLILSWTDDPSHPVSTARALHHLLADSRHELASSPAEVGAWPEAVRSFVASTQPLA